MEIAWEDVISVITQIKGYLIFIGVMLVALVVALVAVKKLEKPLKGFVRLQSVFAFLLVLVVTVNAICLGPMHNTINGAMAKMGTLTEESVANSRDVIERVAEEGIVMVKNDDGALPLET